jgi:hypothetical protein
MLIPHEREVFTYKKCSRRVQGVLPLPWLRSYTEAVKHIQAHALKKSHDSRIGCFVDCLPKNVHVRLTRSHALCPCGSLARLIT